MIVFPVGAYGPSVRQVLEGRRLPAERAVPAATEMAPPGRSMDGQQRLQRQLAVTRRGYSHQIYPNASKLVGYAVQPDASLDEITSASIPYQSPQGLTGF